MRFDEQKDREHVATVRAEMARLMLKGKNMTTEIETDEIKNIDDLRAVLTRDLARFRRGDLKRVDLNEVANTAGKIINTGKVQIAYHALRGEAPTIPFLAASEAVTLSSPQRLTAIE